MGQDYITIRVYCAGPIIDLVIAEMSTLGYDSFLYEDRGFLAAISPTLFDEEKLLSIFRRFASHGKIEYRVDRLVEKNWNEIWEKNYPPIIINNYCLIRASFHPLKKRYPLEILINPKMSFGTGHHETTRLMIKNQLEINHLDKSILDVGCGTGILSIVAEKMGASKIIGLDIDTWAYDNAHENIRENKCTRITVLKDEVSDLKSELMFDIVLANINRQNIMKDIKKYSNLLCLEGLLICSGFLINEQDMIIREANQNGLGYLHKKSMNKWSSLVFQKKTD